MKKLLLASALAIASTAANAQISPLPNGDDPNCHSAYPLPGCDAPAKPPARVTVAPPYQGPPPIGWVYAPYTICGELGCQVNVQADGLNVRTAPNGYPEMSLVNSPPLFPSQKHGAGFLAARACYLPQAGGGSWNSSP